MTAGVRCTVYVDGERIPDGAEGDAEDAPTALSGLSVDWGRESTMDQPAPSTCSFELADAPGGAAFGDVVHVGSLVEVTATGTSYPDPTVPAWADPGFEAGPPNVTGASNLTAARTGARVHAGAQALALATPRRDRHGGLVLAPAPFAAPGTDPGAWDGIPATSPGQRWTFGAALLVPPGATVTLRPALFTGPYASAYEVLDAPVVVVGGVDLAAPAWQVVSGTVVPNVAGAWLGIAVEVWPTGITWDDVPPATTWDGLPAGLTWADLGTVYLDDVTVLAPAAGVEASVLVFAGRVSDLEVAYDESIPAPRVKVTAVDFTADLDNIDVGDTPWPAEALSARVARILALSLPGVVADVDASVAGTLISWRDVDRQAAGGLLAELAASVDGILWSATHQVSGPYLVLEDPASRPAALVLHLDGATVRIVPAAGGLVLSACDQEREPVTWVQAVGDIATRTAVTWLLEGVEDGATIVTEQTVVQVDAAREAAWGVRGVALSTQLRAQADAAGVAARILARTGLGWRVQGVNVDDALTEPGTDPGAEVARLLALLDGTTRNGALLQLADLPAWAPGAPATNVYVEGGRYTFEDGRWLLELTVSDPHGVGPSVTWNDLPNSPAWSWDAFDPGISWDDLRGVGVQT